MLHSVPVILSEKTSFCLLNNCMQRIFLFAVNWSLSLLPGVHTFDISAIMSLFFFFAVVVQFHITCYKRIHQFVRMQVYWNALIFLFAFCVAIKKLCIWYVKFSFNTCWMLTASICTYRSSERISLWSLSHAPAHAFDS